MTDMPRAVQRFREAARWLILEGRRPGMFGIARAFIGREQRLDKTERGWTLMDS